MRAQRVFAQLHLASNLHEPLKLATRAVGTQCQAEVTIAGRSCTQEPTIRIL